MNTDGPNVRFLPQDVEADEAWEDARVTRTTRALRGAMSELLHEGAFEAITVQQILDRAGVARATFYRHYRGKGDVLLASFEEMVAALDAQGRRASGRSDRLLPVRELLEHVGGSAAVLESLTVSGRMEALWDHAVVVLAARIEPRLVPTAAAMPEAPALAARVLAGAAVELIRWGVAHPDAATPGVLDARFQEMARRTYGAFGCGVRG